KTPRFVASAFFETEMSCGKKRLHEWGLLVVVFEFFFVVEFFVVDFFVVQFLFKFVFSAAQAIHL
ncbi:MAG TPA: hypothetical protein VI874_01825, partial [Candidatus Norongarragalinales archaeon]|nr:hypothetical protein [Candidatus Norongarragalinales archaeon]